MAQITTARNGALTTGSMTTGLALPMKGIAKLAAVTVIASLALPAQAGTPSGSITFSPADVAAVPALGGTLLVLLAALLALIAVKAYRRTHGGIAPVVAGALALGGLASAGGGFELIRQANANGDVPITDAGGQTILLGGGPTVLLNSAGVLMRVTDLSTDVCEVQPGPADVPDCAVGTTVEDGERCQVNIVCPV